MSKLRVKGLPKPRHSLFQKVTFGDGDAVQSGTVIGYQRWDGRSQYLSGTQGSEEMGWSVPGWWVVVLTDQWLDTEVLPESSVH